MVVAVLFTVRRSFTWPSRRSAVALLSAIIVVVSYVVFLCKDQEKCMGLLDQLSVPEQMKETRTTWDRIDATMLYVHPRPLDHRLALRTSDRHCGEREGRVSCSSSHGAIAGMLF